ncbi:sensor histidine kinase [Bacteroides sp. 214]|uniref:sensor histidine kinase n=1 Tax=Bacteroides sp. 214 TaxID=2302935 RepID=UPI0013CFD11F|nr:HAMP domain-containing sensor histidine kinase [Bacteroides sp. 214]NDW12320.1 sensor histidine kinase [Bacteroides sp. 214]
MKRILLNIISICCVFLSISASASVSDSPNVLIINSFDQKKYWVEDMTLPIEKKLLQKYPAARITTEYLRADVFPVSIGSSFRSILWSLVDHHLDTSYSINTSSGMICPPDEFAPDVIILIGADAFLYYQFLGEKMSVAWREVPVVLLDVNDKYPAYAWNPQFCELAPPDFDKLVPAEEKRSIFFPPMADSNSTSDSLQYNVTGVKSTIPVKENLDMIVNLLPNLQELIWIDDKYYASEYAYWQLEKEINEHYPEITLSTIPLETSKIDSIYNEMLRPASHRAYITYAWEFDCMFSKRSDEQLRSLFTNYSTVPCFSLTPRKENDGFWVGGYYRIFSAGNVVEQVQRILSGEPANAVPFIEVTAGEIQLDYQLLDKYGLLDRAAGLENVKLRNVPLSYFKENERMILVYIIFGIVIIGLVVYWLTKLLYNNRAHKEYLRYKRLYDRLQMIYGQTAIDLALYDAKGACIYRISNGKELNGTAKANDLLSQNIFENQYISDRRMDRIRNGESINIEVLTGDDGKYAPGFLDKNVYQLLIKPIDEIDYHLARYIATAIDLTPIMRERKEKERFENLLTFASDLSQIGIAFYNIDSGNGTATNSWSVNMNEQFVPGTLPQYTSVLPEYQKELLAYRKRIEGGERETFSKEIRVATENTKHWIDERLYVSDDDDRMLVEFNINVDKQKEHEELLQLAKEEAEKANLETIEFLNSINHEVRTPLNAIVGFSAILAATPKEKVTERQEFISIILKNNQLITMLVDDIIQLSRLESGQFNFEYTPIDIEKLFNSLLEQGHANVYKKQLNYVIEMIEEDIELRTDQTYLEHLLTNLFSNAIKFTEEGGTITLGCRREQNMLLFYVKDTGCGISKANQRRIFKRFDKVNSYIQGTGLGLALSKSIADRLGGDIGVESEEGKGSTFWFTLPL